MSPSFRLRAMQAQDIPAVLAIQAECYSDVLPEDENVIRARLQAAPDFAWVAEDVHGVCAYLVTYPSALGKVTPLSGLFQLPDQPDTLYLHDLAVASRVHGCGLGPQLVRHALSQARALQLSHTALVSVQDTRAFWQRFGYREQPLHCAQQRQHLRSYQCESYYMSRKLA